MVYSNICLLNPTNISTTTNILYSNTIQYIPTISIYMHYLFLLFQNNMVKQTFQSYK